MFGKSRFYSLLVLVLGLAATGCTRIESALAPDSEPWPRWEEHDPANAEAIDFSAWDGFLKRHLRAGVDGVNRVDYGAVPPADVAALKEMLDDLSALPISRYARDQQFAYWINLYNALTVQVILDHYPVSSIRDIDTSPGLLALGPWDQVLVTVEGQELTLNDIEHRIIRPIWPDPRIHYAVNCAAIGCPNLALEAFRADRMEAMLEAAARAYVNDPRGVTIANGKVTVSKIYFWFQEDFGGSRAAVLEHLQRYAAPELAARLKMLGRIDNAAYDWGLNDAAVKESL